MIYTKEKIFNLCDELVLKHTQLKDISNLKRDEKSSRYFVCSGNLDIDLGNCGDDLFLYIKTTKNKNRICFYKVCCNIYTDNKEEAKGIKEKQDKRGHLHLKNEIQEEKKLIIKNPSDKLKKLILKKLKDEKGFKTKKINDIDYIEHSVNNYKMLWVHFNRHNSNHQKTNNTLTHIQLN